MTDNNPSDSAPVVAGFNDSSELGRFLAAYRPSGVEAAVWDQIAAPAAALVMRAGAPTRLRVEKDIQLLGAVTAHLVTRGREITLEEALDDTTLLSFDNSLCASDKTRENKRGIMRRLQAVHRGLPWRAERRPDGERAQNFTSHAEVRELQRVLSAAEELAAADDPDAAAFAAAVTNARRRREVNSQTPDADQATWDGARRFAADRGWPMTRRTLRAVITHEVLERPEPVAVLIDGLALTRRDLDLALTRVATLPPVPVGADHDRLRGSI